MRLANPKAITIADSAFMVEATSYTEGAEWTPLAKGHFPMYALGTAAVTTENGAILFAGRLPGQGLQVSWDHGMTYQAFTIDSTGHGQGTMIEVAPNVVLVVLGAGHLQQQFIQVSRDPNRITPLSASAARALRTSVKASRLGGARRCR